MKKQNLEMMADKPYLVLNGKKILKGAFASTMVLNNEFNRRMKQNSCSTEETISKIIDDYIYRLSHVTDKEGQVYDLISSIKDGKVFEYFPLENWLSEDQSLGKKLIALRIIQYNAHTKESYSLIDKNTLLELLNNIIHQSSGRIQYHAQYALSIVNGTSFEKKNSEKKMDREDPLKILDLQGNSDHLLMDGKAVKKGSIALFFKSISTMLTEEKATNEFNLAIKNSEAAAHELKHIGFFDFFDSPSDWDHLLAALENEKPKWFNYIKQIKNRKQD